MASAQETLSDAYRAIRSTRSLAGADRLRELEGLAWSCPGLLGFMLASCFHLLWEQQDERPVSIAYGQALLTVLDDPIMECLAHLEAGTTDQISTAGERLAIAIREALKLDPERVS